VKAQRRAAKASPSHFDRACAHVVRALGAGLVLSASGASLPEYRGAYTAGPNPKAVGPSGFSVIRYNAAGGNTWEFLTIGGAAARLVSQVGTTRAREAALAAERKRNA
jgi:hypothetical protein